MWLNTLIRKRELKRFFDDRTSIPEELIEKSPEKIKEILKGYKDKNLTLLTALTEIARTSALDEYLSTGEREFVNTILDQYIKTRRERDAKSK